MVGLGDTGPRKDAVEDLKLGGLKLSTHQKSATCVSSGLWKSNGK